MAADLSGQRIAVVGLGKSGIATLRFLLRAGATALGCDDRDEAALRPMLATLGELRHSPALKLHLGGLRADVLTSVDRIVLSPGVPPSREPIVAARRAAVPITGEIELASHYVRAPIVGITGTNGKSTVTSLCGAIASQTGRPTFCGGNLGTPLITAVADGDPAISEAGIVVCELSSYQLETADSLRCRAAVVLNLTPDHLDRYPSLSAYGDAKARIFANMRGESADGPTVRVLCVDDPEVLALYQRRYGSEPALLFSTRRFLPGALPQVPGPHRLAGYVDDEAGDLVLALSPTTPAERYPIADLHLIGRHNLGNALAAFLLMRASGLATYEHVRRAAATFLPLPHRMELVGELAGVRYYDDSKGTNVDAVVAGLDGFPRPLVLIAGGRHKGGSYAPLRDVLCRLPAPTPCRGVLLIGEAAPLLAEAFAGCPFPVQTAGSLPDAVRAATRLCQPGDAVVLSPACSSFDMFTDYAHRAQVFVQAVKSLTAEPIPPSPAGPTASAEGMRSS
jgi:UDP-N-acetylmuramoylalanine--D-glutamate ligase